MDLSEQILAAQDLPREAVECPEWGAGADGRPLTLYVRKPSAAELDGWDNGNVRVSPDGRRAPDMTNASARLVVRVLETGDGKRVFRDDQAAALGRKSGEVVGRLFAVAIRLAGRGPEAAKKNSPPTPGGDSSTGSPAN